VASEKGKKIGLGQTARCRGPSTLAADTRRGRWCPLHFDPSSSEAGNRHEERGGRDWSCVIFYLIPPFVEHRRWNWAQGEERKNGHVFLTNLETPLKGVIEGFYCPPSSEGGRERRRFSKPLYWCTAI